MDFFHILMYIGGFIVAALWVGYRVIFEYGTKNFTGIPKLLGLPLDCYVLFVGAILAVVGHFFAMDRWQYNLDLILFYGALLSLIFTYVKWRLKANQQVQSI